jgi:hypothetical protein
MHINKPTQKTKAMSIVIDNTDPDTIAEQINLSEGNRQSVRNGLRNLQHKFPFVIEWVKYSQLQLEEWEPRHPVLDAASYDGTTDILELHYR